MLSMIGYERESALGRRIGSAVLAYAALVRPRMMRWGAMREELAEPERAPGT